MKTTSIRKIEAEFKELKTAIFEVEKYLEKSDWNTIEKIGVGSSLASIYGGYERIFKICLEDEGIKIPKSEYWHTELLRNAIKNNFAPDNMKETLRGMLSYRHKQVHGYGHQLDSDILRESIKDVAKTFPVFMSHINGLFMKKDQENTENNLQNFAPNMADIQAAESRASLIQGLDKSADGMSAIEGKDVGYIEEGVVAAASEVKYEAQEARTANADQVALRAGQRVTFQANGSSMKLTGTVEKVDATTVTLKCGNVSIPAVKEKGVFSSAQSLPKEHTKEYAKQQAGKLLGDGKVLLAKTKGTYSGKIIGKTPTFAIQKINDNTAVLHRLKDLEGKEKDAKGLLKEGEDLAITRDGANVSMKRAESGERDNEKVRTQQKTRGGLMR